MFDDYFNIVYKVKEPTIKTKKNKYILIDNNKNTLLKSITLYIMC